MTRVLHIALAQDWAAAVAAGSYSISTRGVTLEQEGFIHCSTPAQAVGVYQRFYADLPAGELRLLVVDEQLCAQQGTEMRWDDVPGADQPFPHFYGPIPTAAVVAVLEFTGPQVPEVS
ncbi:DUF952 domain-containing protein [Kineosporia babensis]|uniref:DUF952 domain-containing protein n=1 Tax=Kineosporia babensis TaxID=499548 RepID=A0A9X1N7T6_9ACTN|nr:DUF952 domain-containing protein [Kineosporia babensis]MCD5310052.1 DUF952 domain-containing protein [Kineosporia babensis]